MKKIIIFIILILISLNLVSQVVTVDLNQFSVRNIERVYNEDNEQFEDKFPHWAEPDEIKTVMIYDLSKGIFAIDNERKSKLQIYEVSDKTKGIDEDGDDYINMIFSCTDEEGVKCVVYLTTYDKIGIVQITIAYSNVQVYYHGFIRKTPRNEQKPEQYNNTRSIT